MIESSPSFFSKWGSKIIIVSVLSILLLGRFGYTQLEKSNAQFAVLRGTFHIEPAQPIKSDEKGKIQPGTPVKIAVKIENKGTQTNPPGFIFVQYALAKPLHKNDGSAIFQTEKKALPEIEPGKTVEISFDQVHRTPSVIDFVRDDWSLREYQAMVEIDNKIKPIGTLALTFSAYYYPGIVKQLSPSFEVGTKEIEQ